MARRVKARKKKPAAGAGASRIVKSRDLARQAVQAFRSGHADKAQTLADKALRADPDSVEALNLGGMIDTKRGNGQRAVRRLERARALAPGFPEIPENLAAAYCSLGDLPAAIAVYEDGLAIWPERIGAWCNLGNLRSESGDLPDARSAYERALAVEPDFLPALLNLALVEGQSGNTQRAMELYRRSLRLDPGNGEIHHDLSRLKRFAAGDPDIGEMEGRRAAIPEDNASRMFFDFALAKAYEDSGDFERAFAHMAEGNAIKRRALRIDIGDEERSVDGIIEAFSKDAVARLDGAGFASERPIFIFGMPRSGTSLVEQIVASHPAVADAGELGLLKETVAGPAAGFPEAVRSLDGADCLRLGRAYVANLPADLGQSERVTDKMPGNFRFAGMIRLILPGAKMIHCRRSPLDTCLSCFSIHFPYGQAFTYDLTELGRYYRAYDRLMAHWRAVLGDAVLDVSYEDLVADPAAGTRAILDFCGLPWDDACLAFHQSRRRVKTASSVQVRQPVYTTAVRRWQRFEAHLGPLIEALGDLADVE